MMTSIYQAGVSFGKHATFDPAKRAENVGFKDNVNGKKATETRALKDQFFPRSSLSPRPSSEEQISLFKDFAGWDTQETKFPDGFDINAAIRTKDGQDIRWLDVVADAQAEGKVSDDKFIKFLLENGASLDRCATTTQDSLRELASDVGYQAVGSITATEMQEAMRSIRDINNSNSRIVFLKDFANANEGDAEAIPADNPGGFLGTLDLNATIRKQGGKEYTLLDFAADIGDKKLALFLMEKDATQCSEETKNTFATEFAFDALKRTPATNITNITNITNLTTDLPTSVGSDSTLSDITATAAVVRQRSLGSYMARLSNPLCLAAVVAGAALYAPSIMLNGLISAGYVAGQGFASLAVLPLHAVDEALSGGINLVRTSLGKENMDTRYYLTKTFGGLACLTALATVAICAANPASFAMRFALSRAADLGAHLISFGLEGDQAERTIHDTLKNFNNDLNPDMKWENWKNIAAFTGNLAKTPGFKENYEKTFTAPASDTATAPIAPTYPGMIRGTLATFAVRIYA